MKKAGILLISLLLITLLAITLTHAQDMPNVPGLGEMEIDPETGLPKGVPADIDEAKEEIESKWDYLGKEWKKIFLKNEFVSTVDSLFTEISFVFLILFGMSYSLSLTLFVIIVLWVCFLIWFSKILTGFSAFSETVSWLIAAGLVIILAQLQILLKITQFLGWLVFAKKGTVWNVAMIAVTILAFVFIFGALSLWAKTQKEKKEKAEQKKARHERRKIIKVGEALGQI